MALKKLVAGNWKMHGLSSDLAEVAEIAVKSREFPHVDVALCLPAILIERAVRAVPGFVIGGQDVHHVELGAHTGCTSARMLVDAGAQLTIVGHSERRQAQRESNNEIRAKTEAALSCGLEVILCVGETLEARQGGNALATVQRQLDESLPQGATAAEDRLAIAYEPIWAIGTGVVPTDVEIAQMHSALRGRLTAAYARGGEQVRILYGGSVKAANAAQIFAIGDVDGALVGGASLSAAEFLPIVAAAAAES